MKKIWMMTFVACLALPLLAQNLNAHQWKRRILLVFTPSEMDDRFKKQNEIATRNIAAFKERDLIVVRATAPNLYEKYNVKKETFIVLLIGKDGQPKERSKHPFTAEKLFALIDAMPMRRDEMKRTKSKS